MANDLISIFDVFNKKSRFIGFNDLFDDMIKFEEKFTTNTFPPYNIFTKNVLVQNGKEAQTENHTFIQLACAGYSKNSLKAEFNDKTCVLTIYSVSDADEDDDSIHYSYRGIAQREFKNSWKLSDKLEFVKCAYVDGLLTVEFRNKNEADSNIDYELTIE